MSKAIDWYPIFADRTTLLGGVWHFRRDLISRGISVRPVYITGSALAYLATLIGSILRKISKLPSDGQKTKKLGINGHINISKGHQILT